MAETGGAGFDLAVLGLRVDAREVRTGADELARLERIGSLAERRFISLEEYDRRRAATSATLNRALRERAQTEREVVAMMNQKAIATEQVATKSRLAGAPIARLNNSMVVLARQAAGAHPVVGQLADAVGTFAIGTARMVPVLAGLAAIAVAVNRITRESREAKERLREAIEQLERLQRLQGLPVGGETAVNVAVARQELYRLESERGRLQREIDAGVGGLVGDIPQRNRIAQIDKQLEDLRATIAAGEREVSDAMSAFTDELSEMAAKARSLNAAIEGDLAGRTALAGGAFFGRLRTGFEPGGPLTGQLSLGGGTGPFGRRTFADTFGDDLDERTERVADNMARIHAEIERTGRTEKELNEARIQANDALIRSLENVGRAYGGVTDQIVALTAALFQLWQQGPLPGFGPGESATSGDLARGFGTATLAGVGFGISTGNPVLGGLAGGIAGGFATGGPAGAIIGAVGGIVSGLFETGKRAEEAQRRWRRAFESFEQMFVDLTPLEQNIERLDAAFEQLSGGRDIAEVRERIELLSRWMDFLSPGDQLRQSLQYQIDILQQLAGQYDINRERAEALTKSENDLADARFRALNAPTGYNLTYAGYLAGASFVPTGGKDKEVGDITVNVYGNDDPSETARQVVQEIRREYRRGLDPLNLSFR